MSKRFWLLGCALLLMMTLFSGLQKQAEASHIAGMDIRYECLGPNLYRVHVYWYNDCSGFVDVDTTAPYSLPFDWEWCGNNTGGPCLTAGGSTCAAPTLVNGWEFDKQGFGDVTPLCEGETSQCTDPGSQIKGINRAYYYADFDFSGTTCQYWTFNANQYARNAGIATVNNSNSQGIYLPITIDLNQNPCNTSPEFNNLPVPYLCLNQSFTFNQGAFDADGDSLSYDFGPCLNDATGGAVGQPLPYSAPYTPDSFMSSSTPILVDPVTGDINLTPSQVQDAIVCVYVTEWRNGINIGETIRDIQLTVLDCDNNLPEIDGYIVDGDSTDYSPSGNTFNDTIRFCSNDSIDFFIYPFDADSTDSLFWEWNNDQLPNAVITVDTIDSMPVLHFTHPPLPARPSSYFFIATLTDNGCPINGQTQRSIKFNVYQDDFLIANFVQPNCNTANFTAPVYGALVDSLLGWEWTGDAGLSSQDSAFTYVYPSAGVYDYFLTVTDSSTGCTSTDSGEVEILAAGLDTTFSFSTLSTLCQTDTLTAAYTGVDGTAEITWNFGANAVPAVASGPGPHNVFYLTDGVKDITIRMENFGCTDTLYRSVQVIEQPSVSAGADQYRCLGSGGVQLQATSNDLSPGCVFSWTPGNTLNSATVPNPIATPSTSTEYGVVVDCGGCTSNPDFVTVDVIESPEPYFIPSSVEMCLGQTPVQLPLNVTGGNGNYSFDWFPHFGLDSVYNQQPNANPTADTTYKVVVTDDFGCQDSAFIEVAVHPVPTADAGPDQYLCHPSQTAQLNGMASGGSGVGGYEYEWFPDQFLNSNIVQDPVAFPTQDQTYTLVVTDIATGCQSDPNSTDSTQYVTIFIKDRPQAEGGPDVTLCDGDSVKLGGYPSNGSGDGYTYQWYPIDGLSDPNARRPMASPEHTTLYYVKATSDGCEGPADSVWVTVNPRPTVSTERVVQICPGDSVQLNAQISNAPGNVVYDWEPNTGLSDTAVANPIAFPTVSTNYTLTVSARGCQTNVPATTTVTVNPAPVVDADTTALHQGVSLCGEDSVQLPATAFLPPGVDPATTLFVQWTPAEGIGNPNEIAPMASPQSSTVYYLTATAGFGEQTCSTSDSIEVYVGPALPFSTSQADDTLCRGESTILRASGGLGQTVFTWMPPEGLNISSGTGTEAQVTAAPDSTTDYVVMMQEAGCTKFDTLTVVVLDATVADFVASADSGCGSLDVAFLDQSTGADRYEWDFGDGSPVVNIPNPVHTYAAPGQYTVTLTTTNRTGCRNVDIISKPIDVGNTQEAAYTSLPSSEVTLILPEAEVQFQAENQDAETYTWLFGDGQSSTAMNPIHRYETSGNYQVTLIVTDDRGCTYINKENVYVVEDPEINIPTVFTPGANNSPGINDFWLPRFTSEGQTIIKVYDRWSNLVYEARNPNRGWDGTDLNGNEVNEGVYFYIVEHNDRLFKGNVTIIR